jgi:alpha-tubulin suppressor-like RCC1 family protein
MVLVAALSGSGSLWALACNGIIGVEDVKPRRSDAGGTPDEDVVLYDPLSDTGSPQPDTLQLALGELHSCARKPDGTVKCWGADNYGQTGTRAASDGGDVPTPVDVLSVSDAVNIAAGRNHTCIARRSGTVSCWGSNVIGQLGNGESANTKSSPVDAVLLKGVTVTAGGDFSCAIRPQGGVACWGGNDSGQLGSGTSGPSSTPIGVANLTETMAIAAGQAHACAVKRDGSVLCWGDNSLGQLGLGPTDTSVSKNKPTPVDGSLPASVMVVATERSTCALTGTGSVYCWGANDSGQLGRGSTNTTSSPVPMQVASVTATSIAAGRNHVCAVQQNGAIVCWGAGARGQLGDGQPHSADGGLETQASPVSVSGIQNAVGIGAGGDHSCATTKTNAILCWGANDRGQLGNGAIQQELSPVGVIGYP